MDKHKHDEENFHDRNILNNALNENMYAIMFTHTYYYFINVYVFLESVILN
jgi:hypothetical protein